MALCGVLCLHPLSCKLRQHWTLGSAIPWGEVSGYHTPNKYITIILLAVAAEVGTVTAIFYSRKLFWLPLQYISVLCGGFQKLRVGLYCRWSSFFFFVCMSFSLHVIFSYMFCECIFLQFLSLLYVCFVIFDVFFMFCVFANKSRKKKALWTSFHL